MSTYSCIFLFFFFQAEDGIRDLTVTGVQTCALPISGLNGAVPEKAGDQEKLGKALETCLREALAKLDEMRRAEGKHLVAELRQRLARIGGQVEQVRGLAASLRPAFARRLASRLKELLGGTAIDQGRLAQEAALL